MSDRKKTAVICATFTAEPLAENFAFVLAQAGLTLDLQFCPYNQVFQELLAETSQTRTNEAGLNVCLIRLEDFIRDFSEATDTGEKLAHAVLELTKALISYAGYAKVPSIIGILSPSPRALTVCSALHQATSQLIAEIRTLPGLTVLTTPEIDAYSGTEIFDPVSDELAHIPFTQQYFSAMALAISRKANAILKTPYKVLVLDCDNTIWRGVVGEDGIDGIRISPAFAAVQQFAVETYAQGTLICLLSKNTERDVLEVFETRPDMILSLDQIVARGINWDTKPQNIARLAQKLNLGLDSFVFIDDNPVECEQMRVELPQVLTLQLPSEDKIRPFLANLWVFDRASITDEDKRRTQMYKENAARQQLEVAAIDIETFIKSLNVATSIDPPESSDWPRLAQLTQRTNQFNFTTLRQTESELHSLADGGHVVLSVRVSDRFGDYGLVGLIVAHAEQNRLCVDIFLLSCRVLGRGVEHTVLRHLGSQAKSNGLEYVELALVPTPKNEPARAFIENVAGPFRVDQGGGVCYLLPALDASRIAHRPGHDPDAVIAASKSGDSGAQKINNSLQAAAPFERYTMLAQTLTTGSAVQTALRLSLTRKRQLPGSPAAPSTNIETRMLTLWQHVLGIQGIGIDDDFFSLGGTSLLAAALFAEITRHFQVKMPLTTILDCPTIRKLSSRIERPAVSKSLVELKPGTSRSFFLVHDGDGETLLYANLARRLPDDTAVFGIEPRALPNVALAHTSIKEMASWYVGLIRQVQPTGPYLLGGMCAGGVIAYEMASQIGRDGDNVELLVLLDAATPRATKRVGRITKQRFGRLASAVQETGNASAFRRAFSVPALICKKLFNATRWEMRSIFLRWSTRLRFRLLQIVLERRWKWPKFIPSLTVRQIYESAESQFDPQPSRGLNSVLIRATAGEFDDTPYFRVYSDETFGWGSLASELTVVDVEGGHSSMLQEPFVRSLADSLNALLGRPPVRGRLSEAIKEHA